MKPIFFVILDRSPSDPLQATLRKVSCAGESRRVLRRFFQVAHPDEMHLEAMICLRAGSNSLADNRHRQFLDLLAGDLIANANPIELVSCRLAANRFCFQDLEADAHGIGDLLRIDLRRDRFSRPAFRFQPTAPFLRPYCRQDVT